MEKIVGKYTYGGERITIYPHHQQSDLKIGKFCSIGENITVYLGGNHKTNWVSTYPFGIVNNDIFNKCNGNGQPESKGDVVIGNDVWIGDNVTIMSGVKVGDGAIIGAYSHIISNVKPYSVVGGNPGILYYFRFNPDIVQKLLKLKWWDLDDEIINEISPYLSSGNYNKLFEVCDNLKQDEKI